MYLDGPSGGRVGLTIRGIAPSTGVVVSLIGTPVRGRLLSRAELK